VTEIEMAQSDEEAAPEANSARTEAETRVDRLDFGSCVGTGLSRAHTRRRDAAATSMAAMISTSGDRMTAELPHTASALPQMSRREGAGAHV
jgi:hypothetical protein